MNGLTIITASGGRPQAFALCHKFVERQTYKGDIQWIVVDDGVPLEMEQLQSRFDLQRIFPRPEWKPGQNTLARNLRAALPLVKHEAVIFFENDDWYPADYVEQMAARLEKKLIAGAPSTRYYHVPSCRYRVMTHARYASLCQTALRSSLIPMLQAVCREGPDCIDYRLWDAFARSAGRIGAEELGVQAYAVGMKGLPGRPGIGVGHRPDTSPDWKSDPEMATLERWMGEDVELYRPFTESPEK